MKKNVLQLTPSFHQGGTERQAVQLTRLIHEAGDYNVFLATLNRKGILQQEIEKIGLPDTCEFPLTSFYDLNFLKQLKKCVDFIHKNKIEIVHTHDFYTNIFGMIAAFFARVPGRIASRRETTGIRTKAQKRAEHGAYRLAQIIVANAAAVREQLLTEGIRPDKIEVIYNGLDFARTKLDVGKISNESRRQTLESLGLPSELGRQFVTIVANFRLEVKDHPTFLNAARRVLDAIPFAVFVLAGEGHLIESMKALATRLGLEKSAFFIGQRDSVAELLSISDVCVLSSKAEGFSNSILEYMAAGRPVVVTNVGGARETVINGETGYLVSSGDDKTMAARIVSLLTEPEQARVIGARGQRLVADKFSCASQLEQTQDLYGKLLARVRGINLLSKIPS